MPRVRQGRNRSRRPALPILVAVGVSAVTAPVVARPGRARFEPTDLDLEKPGVMEIDTQVGVTSGDGVAGNRVVLPDFEVDVGLTSRVELSIDGAFSVDHYDDGSRQLQGEALWTGVKLGLLDFRDPEDRTGFAVGAQLGPRIGTVGGSGVGYGALGLLGYRGTAMHSTANLGYFIDPGPRALGTHSKSVVLGLDFEVDLDERSEWSLLGSTAFAYYATDEPTEWLVALGASVDASKVWNFHLTALGGILPGEDRLGILFGATPRFALW